MLYNVVVRVGQDFEKSLREFRKRCESEGVMKKARALMYYRKPSDIRRQAQSKLECKLRRKEREKALKAQRKRPARLAREKRLFEERSKR